MKRTSSFFKLTGIMVSNLKRLTEIEKRDKSPLLKGALRTLIPAFSQWEKEFRNLLLWERSAQGAG